MSIHKPVLRWSTHPLESGLVMIEVDAHEQIPGQPESMIGHRREVHPQHLAKVHDGFWWVIWDMTERMRTICECREYLCDLEDLHVAEQRMIENQAGRSETIPLDDVLELLK
jgi:hypothetical protein